MHLWTMKETDPLIEMNTCMMHRYPFTITRKEKFKIKGLANFLEQQPPIHSCNNGGNPISCTENATTYVNHTQQHNNSFPMRERKDE